MKKIIMILAMITLLLAGCASSTPSDTTENSSTDEAESTLVTEDVDEIEYDYSNSTYKVGTDMPDGEYYVQVMDGEESGYYSVNNDANGDDIFYNENITTHGFITVTEGQYVELDDLFAIPVSETPNLVPTDGMYTSGFYRVGVDIPAGEYKVVSDEGASGYYSILTDSTYQDIETNGNLDPGASAYMSLEEGQYVELDECFIQK